MAARGLGPHLMSRPLPLWGIIESEGAAHYVDRAVDAGVTRLIGPQALDVVELARSRGLEVHPYVACTSLPTHGQRPISYTWSLNYGVDPQAPQARAILDRHRPILVGPSRGEPSIDPFAAAHPEYRSRTADGSDTLGYCDRLGLSLAFPEVRERQAAEIAQALADSGGDGVQVEFVNGMEDADGLVPAGYEERTVREYRQTSGRDARALPADDPAWLAFRAGYVTGMLVEARERVKAICERAVFSATIIAREPERSLHGLHDWASWARRGVLDELYLWFRTESDPDAVERRVGHAARVVAGRIPLYAELSCYHPGSFQEPELLMEGARRALAAGADAVGVYRHHAVDQLGLWGTLAAIGRL